MYNLVEGVDNNNKCSSVDDTYNNTDTEDESNMYEVFFTSELVSGSKIALFSPNLRYQALTQR